MASEAAFARHVTLVTLIVACAFLLGVPRDAAAVCNPNCAPTKDWNGQGTGFQFDASVPGDWQSAFQQAANSWNSMNSSYGRSEMYLSAGDPGLTIIVEVPVSDSGAVAEWDSAAQKIRINPSYLNLSTVEQLATALHEFGHQQGFVDRYNCYGFTVMGSIGPNSPNDFTTDDYCGFNYYYDPTCEAGGGADYYNHCTPLVLSFGRGLPDFSAPEVLFDIGGTGDLPVCSWLQRPTDGFLVLDRNGDGLINDGRELFGNATPYSATTEGPPTWNGFQALAFFDRTGNGGNGNGVIDPADSVFSRLRVWFDRNRDGVSQRDELVPLSALGVEYIQLSATALNRFDTNGNLLWFRSSFVFKNRGVSRESDIVYVILKVK
jgi:hypothetical protein